MCKSLGERREGCQAGTSQGLRPLTPPKVMPVSDYRTNRKCHEEIDFWFRRKLLMGPARSLFPSQVFDWERTA
jgi:hypothetical protein